MDSAGTPSVCFRHAVNRYSVRPIDGVVEPPHLEIVENPTPRAMAASRRLPKHLRNVLGSDAGDELVTILDEIRADNARHQAEFAECKRAIESRFDSIDKRMEDRFDRVDARFATLESKISDVKSDLMKWSFVFWCGAVFAVAALAGVLRQ